MKIRCFPLVSGMALAAIATAPASLAKPKLFGIERFAACMEKSGGGPLDDATIYSTRSCDTTNQASKSNEMRADINPFIVASFWGQRRTLTLNIPIRYERQRVDSGPSIYRDDPRGPVQFNKVNFLFGQTRRDFDGLTAAVEKGSCRPSKVIGIIFVYCPYREDIAIPLTDADVAAITGAADHNITEPTIRGKAFAASGESVEFEVFVSEIEAAMRAGR